MLAALVFLLAAPSPLLSDRSSDFAEVSRGSEVSSAAGAAAPQARGRQTLRDHGKSSSLESSNGFKVFANDKRMTFGDDQTPVTLTVYFEIKDPFEELHLVLPRGYMKMPHAEKNLGCGVYCLGKTNSADSHSEDEAGKEFAKSVVAQHLAPWIENCHEMQDEEEGGLLPRVHIRMTLNATFRDRKPLTERSGSSGPTWWGFALHVKNPVATPSVADNWFALEYFHHGRGLKGRSLLQGWQILGDWGCKYADWEGWGNCPAKCGGGVMRLTRRLLLAPPPKANKNEFPKPCPGPFERNVPCNQWPCKSPCELVDVQKGSVCSAECGGGVRAVRWRWRGDGCPKEDDADAVQFEPCNPQPCKVRCKLADTWTVVTGCSEVCGQGTYRMMREVLQKDQDDPGCQPEWREVKCVRQSCSQLTIIRPDQNILPYPEESYYVGIAFKLIFPVTKITINAPGGYSFGTPGNDCRLHDHDLLPYYSGCKVGIAYGGGRWEEPRSITLTFNNGLLPKSETGRYSFIIPVINPKCPSGHFEEVVRIGQTPGRLEVCHVLFDQNLWEMRLTREETPEGQSQILSLWATGYELHNPKDTRKVMVPDRKEMYWSTTNDGAFVTASENAWRSRVTFCSARLEPCPNGEACPPEGVCPMTDYGLAEGEDSEEQGGSWSLDDDVQVAESDELDGADPD